MSERLDNFKGKRHTFTKEERRKGGLKRTDAQLFRSQTNAIKKGKMHNKLKDCNSCTIPLCPFFEEGKSCSMFNTQFVRLVMFKKNLSSIKEFDDYIFGFLQRGAIAEKSESYDKISGFVHELLEFKEFKNESLR